MLPPKVPKRKSGAKKKSKLISTKSPHLPFSITEELLNFKKMGEPGSLCQVDIGEIFSGKISLALRAPFFELKVQADLPSSIDDFVEGTLDLNEHLISYKSSIFFVRIVGDSMKQYGVFSGDLLVVDRALFPEDEKMVVAILNGEIIVKRFEEGKEPGAGAMSAC